MALLDHCVEYLPEASGEPPTVPASALAERALDLYWLQVLPSPSPHPVPRDRRVVVTRTTLKTPSAGVDRRLPRLIGGGWSPVPATRRVPSELAVDTSLPRIPTAAGRTRHS